MNKQIQDNMESSNMSDNMHYQDSSIHFLTKVGDKTVSLRVISDDITKLHVDAIVNAANSSLLGGGGVDGAIHKAAGIELLHECETLKGCVTGQAKITKGYLLPAKYIIHTVGPVWHRGLKKEPELLASCYKNCLEIAKKHKFSSIAFPNISTGIYGFPKEKAADIAIGEVLKFLKSSSNLSEIIFVCFDAENFYLYEKKLKMKKLS